MYQTEQGKGKEGDGPPLTMNLILLDKEWLRSGAQTAGATLLYRPKSRNRLLLMRQL